MHRPHSAWLGIRPHERHSQILQVCGAIYILIGWTYVSATPNPSREVALKVVLGWWSLPWWGMVFIFVGLLAIVSSRWPPVHETWGYFCLAGLSGGWGAAYLVGVLVGGPATNLSGVLSWGLIGFLWISISGLVNPSVLARLVYQIETQEKELNELRSKVRAYERGD